MTGGSGRIFEWWLFLAQLIQGLGCDKSNGFGMFCEEGFQFREKCRHVGIINGRCLLTQFFDPIFDEADFHDYQR